MLHFKRFLESFFASPTLGEKISAGAIEFLLLMLMLILMLTFLLLLVVQLNFRR